jgi:hypothetical protein
MELIRQWAPRQFNFVHRDVATRQEFDHYVKEWSQQRYRHYPILYIAMHGLPGFIEFGDRRKSDTIVGLDDLEALLAGRGSGRMVHFGACNTMKVHGRRIRSLLQKTNLVCVSGYGDRLDWFQASALDALWLGALQDKAMQVRGVRAAESALHRVAKSLVRFGELRVEYRP